MIMEWELLGLTRVRIESNNGTESKMMPLYVKVINGNVLFALLIEEEYYVLSFNYYKKRVAYYNNREIEQMDIYLEVDEKTYYIPRPYLGELSRTCVDRVERSPK